MQTTSVQTMLFSNSAVGLIRKYRIISALLRFENRDLIGHRNSQIYNF